MFAPGDIKKINMMYKCKTIGNHGGGGGVVEQPRPGKPNGNNNPIHALGGAIANFGQIISGLG
jgi:hypothetical protein